jgi:hypothetical protein
MYTDHYGTEEYPFVATFYHLGVDESKPLDQQVEEKVVSDSLNAIKSLSEEGVIIADASRLGGLASDRPDSRYYIIIGVFRERTNARKLAEQAEEGGFPAELLDCKRGMIAVGISPSDRITKTYEDFKRLRMESFCPKDSWILLNE